jgi:hypothetical protein
MMPRAGRFEYFGKTIRDTRETIGLRAHTDIISDVVDIEGQRMKIQMLAFSTILGLTLFSQSIGAKDQPNLSETFVFGHDLAWLTLRKGGEFVVLPNDSVEGGCWTNIKAVKTAVELELKRSGFKVVEEDDNFSRSLIILSATGYALSDNSCVASYNLLWRRTAFEEKNFEGHNLSSLYRPVSWRSGGVMSGSKSAFNLRLKEAFVELVQSFLNGIDNEQQKIKDAATETASSGEVKDYWSNY